MATILPRHTHHVPWDLPGSPQQYVKAICGVYVKRAESVGKPTCPACQQILREWEEADKEIEAALKELS